MPNHLIILISIIVIEQKVLSLSHINEHILHLVYFVMHPCNVGDNQLSYLKIEN